MAPREVLRCAGEGGRVSRWAFIDSKARVSFWLSGVGTARAAQDAVRLYFEAREREKRERERRLEWLAARADDLRRELLNTERMFQETQDAGPAALPDDLNVWPLSAPEVDALESQATDVCAAGPGYVFRFADAAEKG